MSDTNLPVFRFRVISTSSDEQKREACKICKIDWQDKYKRGSFPLYTRDAIIAQRLRELLYTVEINETSHIY